MVAIQSALKTVAAGNPAKAVAKPKVKPSKLLAAAAAKKPGPVQTAAQNEIDPIIAAIKASAQTEAGNADKAIQGLTNSYAQGIGNINYGAPYSSAEAQQAAVDAALQQSASGQGTDLAAALQQRLQALQGSSGAGAVQQEANSLASQGAGSGQAELASGSAALNQLISDAAAARSYGQKMPGVVRDAGLQGIEQAQGQAQQAIDQGTLQAESQLPSIEQTIKADKLQAQANKQTAAYKNAELSLSGQRNAISQERANISAQQGAARLGIEQQNANTSAARAAQSVVNDNRSYSLRLKSLGLESQRLQLEATKSEIQLKHNGLSPAEVSRYKAMSYGLAHEGFSTIDTGTGKPYTYQTVLQQMTVKGIPPSMAMKALNAAGFKPGVRGAPQKLGPGMFTGLAQALMRPLAQVGKAAETAAGSQIVQMAHEYMGTPYVWGGESPKGFDCSGFAQYLYGKAGISIPRTTYTQWTAGRSVPQSQLVPGDLVFFKGSDSIGGLPGHVGVYVGNGMMIDAPHTGSDVRYDKVSSFGGYMGARRYGDG